MLSSFRAQRWIKTRRPQPIRRTRPGVERLEDRTVPYAGVGMPGGVVDRGDSYLAGGEPVPLLERTGAAVVRVSAAAAQDWAANGLPDASGFTVVRSFDAASFLLASSSGDDAVATAGKLPGVVWSAPVFQATTTEGGYAVVLDEVIVALAPGTTAEEFFADDARFTGYRALTGTPDQFIATTAGHGRDALAVSNELASDRRVAWASPNLWQDWQKYSLPNDALFSSQWHLQNTGQGGGTAGADAGVVAAWNTTTGSASITVAIDDDGIEYTHPDLVGNVDSHGEIANNGIDDDGNGYVDDAYGWDWTANDADPGPDSSDDEHGTSCAGVAVGVGNNTIGVAGAAYTSKFFGSRIFAGATGTSDANIASSLYYAAGRTASGTGQWAAADVISCSWGGGANSSAINAALTWATTSARGGLGVPVFIASGNDATTTVSQPAAQAATNPGVIAVGATTNKDVRADYSNTGTALSLTAPSNGGTLAITTTDRTGANGYNAAAGTSGNYTNAFGGTSSATPLAAGVGALVLSAALTREPTLTAAQLRGLLQNTTDLVANASYGTAGRTNEYGTGRIDAGTAVAGLGVAKAQVVDNYTTLASGASTAAFTTVVGTPVTKTYRVRNQGSRTLNLNTLTVTGSGGFSILNGFSSSTLAVGASAVFTVQFSPTATGTVNQTLTFASNDTATPTYVIALRGTVTGVTGVSGTVYADANGNGQRDAGEAGLGGRTVYLDGNGNNAFDGAVSQQYATGTLALAIPDANATGVTSSQTVAGRAGTVTGVTVTVRVTHPYDSDLKMWLVAPGGTTVPLSTYRGGAGANFTNTTFTDAATTAISAGTAPFSGSYKPESVLSALTGLSPNGTWSLRVVDSYSNDTGTLTGWSVTVNTRAEASAVSDANGDYTISGLAAGTYAVKLAGALAAGQVLTPATGYSTAVTAGAVTAGRDFGIATVPPPAVTSITVDDGSGQRSQVRTFTVQFNEAVTFAGTPAAAFTLTRAGGTTVALAATTATLNGATVATLTTVGGAALADGDYTLTVNAAQVLAASQPMAADATVALTAKLGDADGDGAVDGNDLAALAYSFNSVVGDANYRAWLDFDGDGAIDGNDLAIFAPRFNTV